jgi:hypothetical protein
MPDDVVPEEVAEPAYRPSKGVALSNWLVSAATGFVSARTTRRGFLVRSAMVGSAFAVAGCQYAGKKGPAYARITDCPPGTACRDGYTEFCCVINGGYNQCPPGSFAAGWWRADFSRWCNGTRYYIDCNQACCGPHRGGGFCHGCVPCTCGGTCDNRRIYCNYFRYGQCHQEIAVVGPIACRVSTCTPPWQLDPACSPTGAVDNATADHATQCLFTGPPAPPPPPPPPPTTKKPAPTTTTKPPQTTTTTTTTSTTTTTTTTRPTSTT